MEEVGHVRIIETVPTCLDVILHKHIDSMNDMVTS